jgi:hypothetical protein
LFGFEKQARQPRRHREPQHAAAGVGHRSAGIDGAELPEELLGALHRRCRRRVEPAEPPEVAQPPGAQLQQRAAEIEPQHLRGLVRPPRRLLGLGPQTYTPPGGRAPCPSGPLIRSGAADADYAQRVDAVFRVEA